MESIKLSHRACVLVNEEGLIEKTLIVFYSRRFTNKIKMNNDTMLLQHSVLQLCQFIHYLSLPTGVTTVFMCLQGPD